MGKLKTSPFFYGVLLFLCLCTFFSIYSAAQTKKTSSSNEVNTSQPIKIPPPIEGIEITNPDRAQKLESADIEIYTGKGKKYIFHVELARTHAQQRKGMMHRDSVKPMTGMLFLFSDNRERSFWMKNTFIPLDILFIRSDGFIHHIHPNAEPEKKTSIKSNGEVSAVLEIAGGEAERLGINIGDRILYSALISKTEP